MLIWRVLVGYLAERYIIKPPPSDLQILRALFEKAPKDNEWHRVSHTFGPYTATAFVRAKGSMKKQNWEMTTAELALIKN